MSDQFTGAKQKEFVGQVGIEMGNVVTDPKTHMWDSQAGEEDPKSQYARRTVGAVAAQITLGMILSVLGKNNKGVDGMLMNEYTFIGSLVAIGLCGFLLLLHKHWRMETMYAGSLFTLFTLGIASAIGTFEATWSYSHFWMVLLLSITIGIDCLWFGLYRNKAVDTIQRSMVVGTVIALILVTILVCIVEQETKGEGEVAGASYLAIALGLTFAVCFYVSFDVCVIAIPECDDPEDWINAAIRVYIDIFKALWLMIVMGVTAIIS